MLTRDCQYCDKEFQTYYARTCSRSCAMRLRFIEGKQPRGWSRPAPKSAFKKGMTPWNKDLHGYMPEEQHPKWKGDEVGYYVLHRWVAKHRGKPSFCEHCLNKTAKRYEWANVSGEYRRELDDWVRLCRSCHIEYDRASGRWGDAKELSRGGVSF